MVVLTYLLANTYFIIGTNIKDTKALTKLSTASFPNIANISATKNIFNIGG